MYKLKPWDRTMECLRCWNIMLWKANVKYCHPCKRIVNKEHAKKYVLDRQRLREKVLNSK